MGAFLRLVVDRTGVVMHARFPSAPSTATTTESALAESATVVLVTLVRTVRSARAQTTATALDAAMRTSLATANTAGPVRIALSKLAPRSAPATGFATTALASASLDSLAFTARFLRARHRAPATVSVFPLEMR